MKIEKRVNANKLELLVTIAGVEFKEIVYLSNKFFDSNIELAIETLKIKIENYKKSIELDLVSLINTKKGEK